MGVLYDIYCLPAKPFSVDWSTLLDRLIGDGLALPPLWAGHPLRTIETFSLIRTPDLAPLEATVLGEADAPRAFERLDGALAHVARDDAAMVVLEVPASSVRREPEKFHPMSSYLGLYRFRDGHDLAVGEPDPSLPGYDSEARWRGKVFEFLWIHGKNAPLAEDFEGSSLHVAMGKLWPGCLVLGDERL